MINLYSTTNLLMLSKNFPLFFLQGTALPNARLEIHGLSFGVQYLQDGPVRVCKIDTGT